MESSQFCIEIRHTDDDQETIYQFTKSELKHCLQIIGFQQNEWLIDKIIHLYYENHMKPLNLTCL